MKIKIFLAVLTAGILSFQVRAQSFVQRDGQQFTIDGKPYYYIGANYWYGSVLGLEKDPQRGIVRLKKELDFLKSKGVNNLRVLGGAEGEGLVNGFPRVGPAMQSDKGTFNASVLTGLDILLDEMAKRDMKAIIFFSNNWEWSGGFLQYLNWNGLLSDSILHAKMEWNDMRDIISGFYSCKPCIDDYQQQVRLIINRKNTVNGKRYIDDPTIMAWELANEPRTMRPSANKNYLEWSTETAALIKSMDKNHLLTTGHEGYVGTESMDVFSEMHKDKNIDYLTIHIWPRNWGWFTNGTMENSFDEVVIPKTRDYIRDHIDAAEKLNKPLVIEEFGMPRDCNQFAPTTSTKFRDDYYREIFNTWKTSIETGGPVAGINFWAFNGRARPIKGQKFWKKGDEYMGDPPFEEQGLYGVYDLDSSTWEVITEFTNMKIPASGSKRKKN